MKYSNFDFFFFFFLSERIGTRIDDSEESRKLKKIVSPNVELYGFTFQINGQILE